MRRISFRMALMIGALLLVFLSLAGCAGGGGGARKSSQGASSQERTKINYPNKPVTFIVWSSPGSPLDVFMRKLATLTEKEIGQTIVVDNRTGGNGAAAMSYVNSQPADGYTLLSTTGSMSFSIAKGEIPFKAEDFTMVRSFQAEPSSIAVLKDSPFKTLDDFIKYMKEHPNGSKIGGYASGGFHQYVLYRLQQVAGFEATWIPFEGGADAVTNLLGKHIDVAVITPSSALSQVQNGDIRLLGVSTEKRSPYFPDVPTFKEKGYDVVEMLWRGLMAKKGTPQEVIDRLNQAFDKVIQTEEWKKYMKDFKQEDFQLDSQKLTALVNEEISGRRAFLEKGGFLKKK
ncbi:MAG: tripartite tricarboxylate transporter substrate binding protein [Firmicutes bacterium]|nr:tripartite tricarboxylate transporter substrate binding protein [Bacillota bacterium]